MKKSDLTPEMEAAKAMIKAVYNDGEAEINGRAYQFVKMTHKNRRKVFAFYTRIQRLMQIQDFSFLDWPDFEPVEMAINNAVTFEGSLISKLPTHWDEHPEDYIMFITTALPVISYPFLAGNGTA